MATNKLSALMIAAATASLAAGLFLAGCSVNVKKEPNGQEKQVDINTLIGGIHVSREVSPSDVGVAIYPGARLKERDSDGSDKSANVNISGFGLGIKVVAMQYQSDDAPAKILSFYKGELKKYGDVLECHTSGHFNFNADMKTGSHAPKEGANELSCEGEHGNNTELKVGRKNDQHIVAVEPDGKGSSFSLVYVRTHGKDADI
jgi:hypothetical protein